MTATDPVWLMVAVIWAIVLLGVIILTAVTALPAASQARRLLWQLMASEVVIVLAVTIPFLLGPIALTLAVALLAARIGFESGHVHALAARPAGADTFRMRLCSAGLLTVFFGLAWVLPPLAAGIAIAGLAAALTITALVMPHNARSRPSTASIPGILARVAVVPGIALAAFAAILAHGGRPEIVLAAFLLVEVFDSFSLLAGKLYGRRKPFPRLSPGKTLEGMLTGLAALTVVAIPVSVLVLNQSLPVAIGLVAVVALAAVAGDLLASWPKRRAGVKDYPALHHLQGGLLDITDSWLVVTPILAATLWLWS